MRTTSALFTQPVTTLAQDMRARLDRLTVPERISLCASDPRTFFGLEEATTEARKFMAHVGWAGISAVFVTADVDEVALGVFVAVLERALREGIERTTAGLAGEAAQ